MSESAEHPFQLSTRGSVLIAVVAAERMTDMDAADTFNDALLKLLDTEKAVSWVLDFQNVTFMVTPAINTLITVARKIRERGGRLALTGLNENIAQVFSLMRLDEVFLITGDVDAAVEALTRTGG